MYFDTSRTLAVAAKESEFLGVHISKRMGMPKQPKDARARWDETGKFDKYFSAKPGEGD